jgi:hypothetical protein
MRAISTVFDVMICLLLVSAAVVTLTLPVAQPQTENVADETATVLSGSTASVTYQVVPADTGDDISRTRYQRERHGTLAGLAGRAALAATVIEETPIAPETVDFRRAVRSVIEATIPARTAVTARWEPYPNATLAGQFEAGEHPPENADVQVAIRTVPLPELAVDAEGDFEIISQAIATSFVETMVPTTPGERPLRDALVIQAMADRYEGLAGEDFGARQALVAGEMDSLVEYATDGLAPRVETDMRETFRSPAKAQQALTAGQAWVRVQRWEP